MEWHSITFLFLFPSMEYKCLQLPQVDIFFLKKNEDGQESYEMFLLFVLYQNTEKQNMFVSFCPCDGIWVT